MVKSSNQMAEIVRLDFFKKTQIYNVFRSHMSEPKIQTNKELKVLKEIHLANSNYKKTGKSIFKSDKTYLTKLIEI